MAARAWTRVETGEVGLAVTDGTVVADPDRFEVLLERLFRNLIDGSKEHGATVRVGALAERPSFYVASEGWHSGSLGTAAVGQIADAHGWSIEVADGGTRLEFLAQERSPVDWESL